MWYDLKHSVSMNIVQGWSALKLSGIIFKTQFCRSISNSVEFNGLNKSDTYKKIKKKKKNENQYWFYSSYLNHKKKQNKTKKKHNQSFIHVLFLKSRIKVMTMETTQQKTFLVGFYCRKWLHINLWFHLKCSKVEITILM